MIVSRRYFGYRRPIGSTDGFCKRYEVALDYNNIINEFNSSQFRDTHELKIVECVEYRVETTIALSSNGKKADSDSVN
jgi:hypothetical protein